MTTLKELISIEEKLLQFEKTDKFLIKFNVYIKLEKYLDEIGYITDKYFSLLKQYNEQLTKQDLNFDAKSRILYNFNEEKLETEIDYDVDNVKQFMKLNNIK